MNYAFRVSNLRRVSHRFQVKLHIIGQLFAFDSGGGASHLTHSLAMIKHLKSRLRNSATRN